MDILFVCIGHCLLHKPQDRHFVLSFSSLRGLILLSQPKNRPHGQKLHQNLPVHKIINPITDRSVISHQGIG